MGVPFTPRFLVEKLSTHPEPESLLAISDTLAEYKLESLALQLGENKLDQLLFAQIMLFLDRMSVEVLRGWILLHLTTFILKKLVKFRQFI
ncbi:hypothetical protein SAMN03080617_03519 [Algoriphagus alkaliphilus]|uniref:Uncharacterized protein n=1 Tax=Algoriphagus alkaliphilus TaxID=279824 RepID=A0A1G5ZBH3_9BACT|nr:hypothetical protein SAMN03080617_03519 [Algoriphagus alkaliphilus]